MKRLSIITVLLIVALILSACAAIQTTRHDPVIIPVSMETQLGAVTAAKVETQYRILKDDAIQNYVKSIGLRLAKASKRSGVKFSFKVVNDTLINAFAVPGGFIYVTTGLIKILNTEDELAAVIGHEIGHIERYHSVKQMQRALVASMGMSALLASLSDKMGDKVFWAQMIGNAGLTFLFAKNSRENEFEADEYGALSASNAGYDPYAMVDVQKHLLKQRKKMPSELEQMLSTHPISEKRIVHAKDFIYTNNLAAKNRRNKTFNKIKGRLK